MIITDLLHPMATSNKRQGTKGKARPAGKAESKEPEAASVVDLARQLFMRAPKFRELSDHLKKAWGSEAPSTAPPKTTKRKAPSKKTTGVKKASAAKKAGARKSPKR
ncbi:MAG: hypothetical protein J0I77_01885 [Rudaea sp.]|uniref:hypothetical protein n=2 Tax=unclassified Rudaea TaxID=2627037 RepID=UPI001AD1E283|nr:hypothetical protein [Rudaea sp.]MBN8884445.1 hypothetical protein [Rudaea sp.]